MTIVSKVVIRLLLFSMVTILLLPAAYAQSDSEFLTLHFAAPQKEYSFGLDPSGEKYSGIEFLNIDTIINIMSRDTDSISIGNYSVAFIIDLSQKQIRNFSVSQSEPIGDGAYGEAGSGSWTYSSIIDSMTYGLSGTSLAISPIIVQAAYSVIATWASSGGPGRNDYEYGGVGGNGTEFDTLSLELSPLNSSVSNSMPADSNFSVTWKPAGQREANFTPGSTERKLEVINILGIGIASFVVPPGESSLQLPSLPVGIYFARLGNQIANFVVTE